MAVTYSVAIQVKTLTKTEWKKVTSTLSQEALFTAKLLAGEMPENIGEGVMRT